MLLVRRQLRVGHAFPLSHLRRCFVGRHPCQDKRVGERRVPWVSGRAGPDAPSRLRAWPTPRSDRRRPAVGRVARGCAPHDWRLGRPAGRCNREWEVPLGACKLPVGGPTGSLQAPSGIPSGTSPGPTGSASGTFKARLEKRVGARRERLGRPTGTLGLWRGAIAESHSPARGAPRVLPLGCRATTVRAPLPLGYLPTGCAGCSEKPTIFFC